MLTRKKETILEARFVSPKITEGTIEDMQKSSSLYHGHVKTSRGDIYMKDEFQKRSDRILKIKLP